MILAVAGLSFGAVKAELFSDANVNRAGILAGGAAFGYVADSQLQAFLDSKATGTKTQALGGFVWSAGTTFVTALTLAAALANLDQSTGNTINPNVAAMAAFAAVVSFVYQQNQRTAAQQDELYDYAGQAVTAAESAVSSATATSTTAAATKAKAPVAPAKK